MSDGLTVTRVFSLEQVLCLVRPARVDVGDHALGTPAVLTISRGGRPHEPRLVLFGDNDINGAGCLGTPVFCDSHIVMQCDDRGDPGRREFADALNGTALRTSFGVRDRLRKKLDRYPGCSVAVVRRGKDHLAVERGGSMVATRSSSGAEEMWASICGSFLYCWSVAGFALGELPRAALIIGRFTVPRDGRPGGSGDRGPRAGHRGSRGCGSLEAGLVSVKVVVAGTASCYTTVRVDGFPLSYDATSPAEWARVSVSGVATHVAKVQRGLGCDVHLCTVVGKDAAGTMIRAELDREGLLGVEAATSESSSAGVVLVDRTGRRMGLPYLTPVDQFAYPFDVLREQARGADLLVMTNARFVRPLVEPAAALAIPIAVDVHLISDLDDEYDRPWLERAQIIFCSHERIPDPRAWVAGMFSRYRQCEMVGMGMGSRGALLSLRDGTLVRVAAAPPARIVNTSGAGDALFATFLAQWLLCGDPVAAMQCAVLHSGWKIGHRLPSTVALTAGELAVLRETTPPATAVTRWDR